MIKYINISNKNLCQGKNSLKIPLCGMFLEKGSQKLNGLMNDGVHSGPKGFVRVKSGGDYTRWKPAIISNITEMAYRLKAGGVVVSLLKDLRVA